VKIKDINQIAQLPAIPATKPAPRSEVKDRVESSRSEITETMVKAEGQAELDHAKNLEAIRQAVTLGTYQPDPGRVAEEILASARLLARLRAILG